MKKFLLTLGVASMTLTSFAFERVLYQQNFENATDPAAIGWTTNGTLSISSDDNGKFLVFNQGGGSGGRSATLKWGNSIYTDASGNPVIEDGKYTVYFEFCINQLPNKNFDSDITVFTNHEPIDGNTYRLPWSKTDQVWNNFLLDIAEVSRNDGNMQVVVNAPLKDSETEGERPVLDTEKQVNLIPTKWYSATSIVDVETREVEYSIMQFGDDRATAEGTWVIPETNPDGSEVSVYAEGITFEIARANGIDYIDNIKVTCESSVAIANEPVITLTRLGKTSEGEVDLNLRAYNISFSEGETLHITGTDGASIEAEWFDCDGIYPYETTKSGVLKAWTTIEDAVSEVVETEVECVPVKLPEVTATVSAVTDGFGKTYTLTITNADVLLRPDIFINYEFEGVNGEKVSANEATSGVKVTVTEAGTLTVTSEAFGYESSTMSVKNDQEFKQKKEWDFARLTHDQITAALPGAEWGVTNSGGTSGFSSWTGRKQLFYYVAGTEHENDEGEMVYDTYLPFGYVSDDNTVQVMNTCLLNREKIPETKKGEYFEGLTIFPDRGKVAEGGLPNVGIIEHIGLYNDQTTNNYNNVVINDLDQNDFIYINAMGNYGRDGSSNHPICSNDAEYYDQLKGSTDVVISVAEEGVLNEETNLYDLTYALYRIDTALMKIVVYQPVGGGQGVEGVEAVSGDNNWYSIDGVRVESPAQPGLYIHNGKKYIVK